MNPPIGGPTAPDLGNNVNEPVAQNPAELILPPEAQPETPAAPSPVPDNFWDKKSEPAAPASAAPTNIDQNMTPEVVSDEKNPTEQDKARERQARHLVESDPATNQEIVNLARSVDEIVGS